MVLFYINLFTDSILHLPGSFAYIGRFSRGQLKSPLLSGKPANEMVGLCLRFRYLMPTKSKSYLKVLLWEATEERELLVWQLLGYHGPGWSVAQVVLPSSVSIQVREASISFEGNLFLFVFMGEVYIYACYSLETFYLVIDNIIFYFFLYVLVL